MTKTVQNSKMNLNLRKNFTELKRKHKSTCKKEKRKLK